MTPVYCTSIGHLGPLEHYFPICREQNEETKHRPLLLVSLRCPELSSMNVCQNDVCIFSELDFWLSSTYGWASFRNHVWWEKKVVHPKLCGLCRCPCRYIKLFSGYLVELRFPFLAPSRRALLDVIMVYAFGVFRAGVYGSCTSFISMRFYQLTSFVFVLPIIVKYRRVRLRLGLVG